MVSRARMAVGEPADAWPLTNQSLAASDDMRSLAAALFKIQRVEQWISSAGDADLCDRRAVSLLTTVSNFRLNALQNWPTPKERREHYQSLADRLSQVAGEMAGDTAPAIQGGAVELDRLAAIAKQLACAAGEDEGRLWSLPKPHYATAARNDFIRSLSPWLRRVSGKPHHEVVADVVNVLFPGQLVDGTTVQGQLR